MDFTERLGLTDTDPDATDRPGDDAGVQLTTSEEHANTNGTVHGGVLATMLDAVMGRAVRAGLDDGQSTATVSMTVTYLRPGKVGQTLTASAEVRQRGDSLVMVEADVTGEDGKAVAHGVAAYTVLDSD
ncbi:MAG: PaaI family thioesterase [Micrococcales bacterium]|nr:PaaI family thioesterase [Micrococcales bacterium]